VVDDQFGGRQWVDGLCLAAELDHGIAHGGQVDDCGHAGEVLQDDARRGEGDLGVGLSLGVPVEQRVDVLAGDVYAVLVAQQVLQQDAQRVGQARDALFAEALQRPDGVFLAIDLER
jgi:hypothetical protein